MTSSALFSSAPAMQSLVHTLNIGTLDTWLSVAGFGTVGVVVPPFERPEAASPPVDETILSEADFSLGDVPGASQPPGGGAGVSVPEAIEMPPETLPEPPVLPELADIEPLPEIPALPAAKPAPSGIANVPRQSAANQRASGASASSASRGSASSGQGSSSATGGSGGSGGSGMSAAARLAAGRMPAPVYPATCRRNGQTGTVVVEFTVDSSGRVISAHAAEPSPWPLLDHEAVRTVRKWKFPPGDVMKLRRPIVFQLR